MVYTGSKSLPCNVALCDVQCSDKAILIKHLRPHIKDGLRIVCPIKGCHRKYNTLSSFSCHVNRDHKSWSFSDVKAVQKAETQTNMQAVHTTVSHPYSTAIDNEEDSELNLQKPSECTEIVNKMSLRKILRYSLHGCLQKNLVPDSTIDIVASELQNISSLHLFYVAQNVKTALSAVGASNEVVSYVLSAIDSSDLVKESLNPGGALSSSCQAKVICNRKFCIHFAFCLSWKIYRE